MAKSAEILALEKEAALDKMKVDLERFVIKEKDEDDDKDYYRIDILRHRVLQVSPSEMVTFVPGLIRNPLKWRSLCNEPDYILNQRKEKKVVVFSCRKDKNTILELTQTYLARLFKPEDINVEDLGPIKCRLTLGAEVHDLVLPYGTTPSFINPDMLDNIALHRAWDSYFAKVDKILTTMPSVNDLINNAIQQEPIPRVSPYHIDHYLHERIIKRVEDAAVEEKCRHDEYNTFKMDLYSNFYPHIKPMIEKKLKGHGFGDLIDKLTMQEKLVYLVDPFSIKIWSDARSAMKRALIAKLANDIDAIDLGYVDFDKEPNGTYSMTIKRIKFD